MKVTRFEHVSINNNGTGLSEMIEFYREVVGLGDEPRPDIPGVEGHWLGVGDQQLHLVGSPMTGGRIDPFAHHFCLAVENLDEAIAELEVREIPYLRAVQGEGTVQIWIADPAGNTLELQQDTRTE